MHMEVQVALNFVISFLYNKLPRRRVNIFGEELEKALKDKFHGHWYPDKPFKGSAFRCLKTSEPTDIVLEVAARESGVPISDILDNLPAELSVWVDPGEVSFRVGEKGPVKILYSEQKHTDLSEDNCAADREVTSTFNPEAQCFRPIEIINSSMNALTLSSPKASPNDTASISSTSPLYKNSNTTTTSPMGGKNSTFQGRREPVLFTTASFAQTKFGSTKLKSNSKRTNRMSPTEFSNYIKQRQQLQHHNSNHYNNLNHPNIYGAFESVSPARSISPNVANLQLSSNDTLGFAQSNAAYNLYQNFSNPNGMLGNLNSNSFSQFGSTSPIQDNGGLFGTKNLDATYSQPQQQQRQQLVMDSNSQIANSSSPSSVQQDNSKLFDDLSSFYNNNSSTAAASYQHHLLVAN